MAWFRLIGRFAEAKEKKLNKKERNSSFSLLKLSVCVFAPECETTSDGKWPGIYRMYYYM